MVKKLRFPLRIVHLEGVPLMLCPRPRCGSLINPPSMPWCENCYQHIPGRIRIDLESPAIRGHGKLYRAAVEAAVMALSLTKITSAHHTGNAHRLAVKRGLRRKYG